MMQQQFFPQQPVSTGNKRKADHMDVDMETCQIIKNTKTELPTMTSLERSPDNSPVLSLSALSHVGDLDMTPEPSVGRRASITPPTTTSHREVSTDFLTDPWAMMREPCSFCQRGGVCTQHMRFF
jgi:hypothetical protein